MNDMCTDNRFDVIQKYKQELIESTNIETSSDEMKVIDTILFRFWQMGWLDKLDRMKLVEEAANTLRHSIGDSAQAVSFRNAGRFVQNAMDGKTPDFEKIPESIPTKWITNEIAQLRNMKNSFADVSALTIEALLKRWNEGGVDGWEQL